MNLSYGQMEAALRDILAIHPDRVGTFKSRIKQLQRLGFPDGVNVGRGAKMSYGADHVFKLASAFSLLQAGLAAERATRLISDNWTVIQFGLGIAAEMQIGQKKVRTIYAVLFERLLAEIQTTVGKRERSHHQASVVSEKFLGSEMRGGGWHSYAPSVIRLSDLFRDGIRALEAAGVDDPLHDAQFGDWAAEPRPVNVLIEGL